MDDAAINGVRPFLVDPLGNDLHPDGQALELTVLGGGTTCEGEITESLGLLAVVPSLHQSDNCVIRYRVVDEDGLFDDASVAVTTNAVIFADGFEVGSSSQWDLKCSGSC